MQPHLCLLWLFSTANENILGFKKQTATKKKRPSLFMNIFCYQHPRKLLVISEAGRPGKRGGKEGG